MSAYKFRFSLGAILLAVACSTSVRAAETSNAQGAAQGNFDPRIIAMCNCLNGGGQPAVDGTCGRLAGTENGAQASGQGHSAPQAGMPTNL